MTQGSAAPDPSRIEAERACERLLNLYAHHQDSGDYNSFADLYADDAVWVKTTPPVVVGREAIRAMAREMFGEYGRSLCSSHLLTNIVVDVDLKAGTAQSVAYPIGYRGKT